MTNAQPLLKISDGTTSINLLDLSGFLLYDWTPAIPEAKSGGIWKDSPLFEGRQLAYRKLGTVIDTFDLKVRGRSQDDAIRRVQELRRLLEKAISYWTDDAQNQPVYLVARAPYETNTRYAVILDYRTPRDANPFKQPFFGCTALVDQFQLAVEHGIWQNEVPGEGTCTEISAQQSYNPGITIAEYQPVADNEDCYCGSGGSFELTKTYLIIGEESGEEWETGICCDNVTIPVGSVILNAWLELVSSGNNSGDLSVLINGEDVDDAPVFTNRADFVARTRTSAGVEWNHIDGWDISTTYESPDIAAVVQEIVDRPGWASGNNMVIFIKNNMTPGRHRDIGAVLSMYTAPRLRVRYTNVVYGPYGREETCNAGEVFIVNKHNRANLTHIFSYDAAPVTWSANLIGSATPFALLPATPAAGDIIYFGIQTSLGDSGPFNNLVFDISTAQASLTTIVWEYSNGAGAWPALTVQDNTTTTDPFDRTGVHSVHWVPPAAWATEAVNGVTGYWVRARVTVVGAGPTPPYQDNRDIYSIVWPCVELQADQVEGDLPLLARIIIANQSDASGGTPDLRANRIVIGSRSLSKGENFTPYLNCANEQNPPGITVGLGPHCLSTDDISTPTGKRVTFTSDAEETNNEYTFTLDETISPEYHGRFRAFLRYKFHTGSAGDVSLQLITTPGGSGLVRYSDVCYPQVNTDWQTADFGIINIPSSSPDDSYGSITFAISIYASATGKVVYLYDLILIPVDEWSADVVDKSGLAARTGAVGSGDKLDIDSIAYPRHPDRAVLRNSANNYILGYYQNRTSGYALLQANAEQRLWFLCIYYESGTELSSSPNIANTVQIYKTQRYHGFRGAR